jgi:hypothetical protein
MRGDYRYTNGYSDRRLFLIPEIFNTEVYNSPLEVILTWIVFLAVYRLIHVLFGRLAAALIRPKPERPWGYLLFVHGCFVFIEPMGKFQMLFLLVRRLVLSAMRG